LLYAEGLKAAQIATIGATLPVTVLIVMMSLSLQRALRKECVVRSNQPLEINVVV
jgi:choline-glycine betaine transporter